MAEYPALPLWTDAYLADTRHLSTLEHGAYLLLLQEAWRRPTCSLPDNDGLLARLAGLSVDDWSAVRPAVMAFWDRDGRRKEWTQKRLLKERSYVALKSRSQSDNSLKRWKAKKKIHPTGIPTGIPNASQTDPPTPTPTPTVIKEPPPLPPDPEKPEPLRLVNGGSETGGITEHFISERSRLYPNDPRMPAPLLTIYAEAEGWLDQGIKPDKLRECITAGIGSYAKAGKSPPRSLAAFGNSLQDAAATAEIANSRDKSYLDKLAKRSAPE